MAFDVRFLMERSATQFASLRAVADGKREISYAEAWERGRRMAGGLSAMGLKPGDRVGVLQHNTIEAVDFLLGATIAGLVWVPLYARNGEEQHYWMLHQTQCRAVVVSQDLHADLDAVVRRVSCLEHLFVRDEAYETWLQKQDPLQNPPPLSENSLYCIRHTGGTTGRPKGVPYTHKTWIETGRGWFSMHPPIESGDVFVHLGPISHGSGYFFTPIWLRGGCNVLLPQFDAAHAVNVMERERAAFTFMVPTMLNSIVRIAGVARRDWSSFKVIQLGAAPISEATALKGRDVFGDTLYQGYGLTEAAPVLMMTPREFFGECAGSRPLRAAGRPMPYVGIEIRGEDGKELPVGEIGEIYLRCDQQLTEFWQDEEETESRLVDGWLRTGDLAARDANGFVYIHDRVNDVIISGGFNIYPSELESAISAIEGIVESVVFGVPDDRWGETPLAVCVTDGVRAVTEDQVIQTCASRLGSYKKPSRVQFTTEPLPKSPVGKLQRKVLREPYWVGHSRRIAGS